jgi:hypothetical protein
MSASSMENLLRSSVATSTVFTRSPLPGSP